MISFERNSSPPKFLDSFRAKAKETPNGSRGKLRPYAQESLFGRRSGQIPPSRHRNSKTTHWGPSSFWIEQGIVFWVERGPVYAYNKWSTRTQFSESSSFWIERMSAISIKLDSVFWPDRASSSTFGSREQLWLESGSEFLHAVLRGIVPGWMAPPYPWSGAAPKGGAEARLLDRAGARTNIQLMEQENDLLRKELLAERKRQRTPLITSVFCVCVWSPYCEWGERGPADWPAIDYMRWRGVWKQRGRRGYWTGQEPRLKTSTSFDKILKSQ